MEDVRKNGNAILLEQNTKSKSLQITKTLLFLQPPKFSTNNKSNRQNLYCSLISKLFISKKKKTLKQTLLAKDQITKD